ncbi:hypothetical protein GCK32_020876 [Trichostrongylus colubriformis]|uniref:Uncharacterized protein n=1 Tax=Trichostrongylus colubriformis TaxID=6319 RepID=A0AAN8EZA8_TRICO
MTTPFPMDPMNQFIPPPTAISIVHDGSAELLRPFVTPPPPFTLTTTPLSGFPTLIPFAPSIDDVQESRLVEGEFTNVPFIHSTIVKSMHHRGRTTPDPRIIRPPDSLVVIGDYDEYDTKAVSAGVQTTTPSVPADIASVFSLKPSIQSGGIAMPKSSISEEVIPIGAESTPSTQT